MLFTSKYKKKRNLAKLTLLIDTAGMLDYIIVNFQHFVDEWLQRPIYLQTSEK